MWTGITNSDQQWLTKLTNTAIISVHQSNCNNNYSSTGSDLHLCSQLSRLSQPPAITNQRVSLLHHCVAFLRNAIIPQLEPVDLAEWSDWLATARLPTQAEPTQNGVHPTHTHIPFPLPRQIGRRVELTSNNIFKESIPGTNRKKKNLVGLERGALSLVSTNWGTTW
jgi:hypothetical protein